jgi:hypothetical protein
MNKMLKSWKRKAGSMALAGGSLLQPGKVSYLGARVEAAEAAVVSMVEEAGVKAATAGTEAAAASSGRAVAGTAAGAGVGGGALVAGRGCRSAASAVAEVSTVERTGLAAEEALAGTRTFERSASEIDRLLADRPLSSEAERLVAGRSSVRIPQVVISPVQRGITDEIAAHRAVREVGVELFDASGRKLAPSAASAADGAIEQRVALFTREVLEELPADQFGSDEAVAEALEKVRGALKADPKFKYELDIATGKLKIKYLARRGEISGEINAYAVVRKAATNAAISGGLGYWGYRQFAAKPAAAAQSAPHKPNPPAPAAGTTTPAPAAPSADAAGPGATAGPAPTPAVQF